MERRAPAVRAAQPVAVIPARAATSEAPAGTVENVPGERGGLAVGQAVVVSGRHEGVVRYLGPADFADGLWVGVELLHRAGEHDGAVFGRRYFSCPDGRGLLCHPCQVVEARLASELEESLRLIEARAKACVPFQAR